MNYAARIYAEKMLSATPKIETDYKVGDKVTFTNEYGVSFAGNTVIGFSDEPLYGRFIHLDHDCYWFPVKPESLAREVTA